MGSLDNILDDYLRILPSICACPLYLVPTICVHTVRPTRLAKKSMANA